MKVPIPYYLLFLVFFLANSASAELEKDDCSCTDGASLHSIDELLTCYNEPRCEDRKLDVSVALHVKGRSLAEAIKSYLALSNNANLNINERKNYLNKIEQDRKRLKAIKNTIKFRGYDELIEPLYLDYDSPEKRYYRHYSSFNIGYEYVGLDRLFQEGFPRIGFLHYRRFGEAPANKQGLGYYGVHLSGNMQLTSSAEQATILNGNDIENTLIVTASAFVPFFHSIININRSLGDLTGVLVSYGAKKSSSHEHIDSRFYAGFRNAFNPETYIDVLFGSTQGVKGSRIEINAHLPVYKFEHGSRIFFGGTLNMATPWDAVENEPDLIRFYLEWNADFEKIIEGVKSTFGV